MDVKSRDFALENNVKCFAKRFIDISTWERSDLASGTMTLVRLRGVPLPLLSTQISTFKEALPHILEVQSPARLSLISIYSFSCNDVPFTAISKLLSSKHEIPAAFGTAIHDMEEDEGSTTHKFAIQREAYQNKTQTNYAGKRPTDTDGILDPFLATACVKKPMTDRTATPAADATPAAGDLLVCPRNYPTKDVVVDVISAEKATTPYPTGIKVSVAGVSI